MSRRGSRSSADSEVRSLSAQVARLTLRVNELSDRITVLEGVASDRQPAIVVEEFPSSRPGLLEIFF